MRRRTLWGLVLLLLAALPALAQGEVPEAQEAPAGVARFLIETITVEGPKQAAANIVRAETLLRPGESYTEDQLRLAVYRVHRLPFVLDASFSLRKGSRRGAYELVIEVQTARWFFYDHWIRAYSFGQRLDLEDSSFDADRTSVAIGGVVGARMFVGRSGVVFGAFDSRDGLQAGFTQYDLFGRGILASAGVSRELCCVTEVLPLALDPTFSSWTFEASRKVSLGMSVPLGGRQSLQLSLSDRRGDPSSHRGVLVESPDRVRQIFSSSSGELAYQRAEAKWVYDTSDDPFLPTRGTSLSAGVEAARFSTEGLVGFSFEPPFGVRRVPAFHSEQVVAAVSGIRHVSLTPKQTVSLMARVFGGPSRVENLALRSGRFASSESVDSYGGSVGIQHSLTLKRQRRAGTFLDLRLESGTEIGFEKTAPDFGPSPLKRFAAWTGLVFRNPWGRIRATFTYLSLGEVTP